MKNKKKSTCKIDQYGNKYWYLNGLCHRENDLPAVEGFNGTKEWFINGKLHRENDKPAIEYFNGDIIKIPTKVEYRESLFLSLCFYLKEVRGWNWIQIKEYINLSEADKELLSSISLGKKINAIKDHMGKDMMDLIKNMDIEQLQDVLNGVQI